MRQEASLSLLLFTSDKDRLVRWRPVQVESRIHPEVCYFPIIVHLEVFFPSLFHSDVPGVTV